MYVIFSYQLSCLLLLVVFQGHIEQWIEFASLEVDSNILTWFRPRMGRAAYLPPVSNICGHFSLLIFLIPF